MIQRQPPASSSNSISNQPSWPSLIVADHAVPSGLSRCHSIDMLPSSEDFSKGRAPSPVRRVEREVLRDLGLPAIAVREQLVLVVEQLLARLGGELEIGTLDDRVDRAGFLAEAAIDAFRHVDVVARRAPAAIGARLRLDGDGERRAHGLAKLARDAALLAIGTTAQRMFATKPRAERPLLVGIVDRHRLLKHVAEGERHAFEQLDQQPASSPAVEEGGHGFHPLYRRSRRKFLVQAFRLAVPRAAQFECLMEARLQVAVRGLDRAILVADTGVVAGWLHAVVAAGLGIRRGFSPRVGGARRPTLRGTTSVVVP